MSPLASRAFLFADEWLWIATCLWLLLRLARWAEVWRAPMLGATQPWRRCVWLWALLLVLLAGAVAIYLIGYPMLWRLTGEAPW